ncbi:hypothetical protein C1H46_035241 [Malus baccata]|uniref:Uncharacterized protein n=1 Tax=Malus baccata TaxID=106549 RepID=A0A540KYA0_MALBA|nr:hypothetical protein C1H46_035241 [Malus baccata]
MPARPTNDECYGVEAAFCELQLLLDQGLIPEPHCEAALKDDQQHVTLFLTSFYVLDEA